MIWWRQELASFVMLLNPGPLIPNPYTLKRVGEVVSSSHRCASLDERRSRGSVLVGP